MNTSKLSNKFDNKICALRSECKSDSDREYFSSLFERNWEVFVIKKDPETGLLKGETICCESVSNHQTAVCC